MEWCDPSVVLARASEGTDVVQRLVPDNGITWLYGSSMSFKSFVAMSIAVAVSRGEVWMGHRTRPSLVLYVGAEGGAGLHARRYAAEGGEPGRLLLLSERPRLDTPAGASALRGMLNAFAYHVVDPGDEEMLDKYFDPDVRDTVRSILVVIDTYSQTAGGDEKENVSAYVKNLRDVIGASAADNLAVLVVDHATKSGGTYLGSVAKLNDVDSQLELSREGDRACLRQVKSKDTSGSPALWLELERVELPFSDAYGDALSTLVVRDGTPAKRIADVADGHAGVLLGLLGDWGGESELRDRFVGKLGGRRDSAARAFRRALDKLVEIGAVNVSGGVVKRT